MGICDALLDFIGSFLENRFQRVVLNGQKSEWLPVRAGVPQGSILGLHFFLIYINAYQLILHPLLNCLQMIHHFSLLFMMLRQQHMN